MNEAPSNKAERGGVKAVLLGFAVAFALLLAAYVGSYPLLGDVDEVRGIRVRDFDDPVFVDLYGPLGWCEAQTTGHDVLLIADAGDQFVSLVFRPVYVPAKSD